MNEGMITLTDDDGQELDFYILEQTELGGQTYLLVTDSDEDEEDAEALILREIVTEDNEAIYETVEDETTMMWIYHCLDIFIMTFYTRKYKYKQQKKRR